MLTFRRRFVCAVIGHRGYLSGGPFAIQLHCVRCERDFWAGM